MNFYYNNYYDSDHGDGGYHPNSYDSSSNFAFYSDHGDGGYYPTSYDSSSNFASYNDYKSDGETEFFDQVPARYYTPYGYVPPQPTLSYSASTFSHSDLITIHPNAYYSGSYDPKSTSFAISYSKTEFNEPDFEEYDPTPYGGGYDPSVTYGKPLPPSAEICHPHSTRAQDAPALGGVQDGIPELPIATVEDEQARKPGAGSEIVPAKIDQEVQNSSHQTEEDSGKDIDHRHEDHEESEQSYNENSGYSPWGVYGGGFQRMVPPAPPGCGLDAWDICDGVFGYWPCLSRDNRRNYGVERIADREYCRRNEDQWQGTADFLFGSTNPYAERKHDSQVGSGHYYAHANERQSEGQLYYEQVEYEHYGDSNPW
ncbi:uncharacterized protein LOC115673881 [Syzygium oleosum]|uniref:uncharacterized protein LOC115673881 n=1 Tax=Syzygium oleosum TaxID=219896 RepID=UPI0011D22744|nr:uncharacterized protein LOC115673881 [Syzygium oleosum]